MKKKMLLLPFAVALLFVVACKRGTADPDAIAAEQKAMPSNLPEDVTFAADAPAPDSSKIDSASAPVPEVIAKEQLAAQQERITAEKTNVPPAAKKKPAAKQKRPADPVPVQYSSKNHPSSWSKSQIKWAGIVEQYRALQVGDAASRMSNQGTEAYNGVYALYAVHRYLYLGNSDQAEAEWKKFSDLRNGPQSALLNDLFEVSKAVDYTFAKFVAAKNTATPKKKKKR